MKSEIKSKVINLAYSEDVKMPSDKKFGLTIGIIFLLISTFLYLHHKHASWYLISAAAIVITVVLVCSKALHPLNWTWFKIGMLVSKITNPIIFAGMFYVLITPAGLIMRVFGKRPITNSVSKKISSYWIERKNNNFNMETFKNQF